MELKNTKFKTDEVVFKPYNLVEFKMKQPLDEFSANLFDPENIFKKLHMDHMFIMNFAHPISDPSSALLLKKVLENVDLKMIVKQYMLQVAVLFLAGIQEKMNTAEGQIDDMDIHGSLEDFRSGFDRRLSLITVNHVLLNMDKTLLDGTLFERLLNVKNPGEWMNLTNAIKRDHFQVKNVAKFEEMKNRLVDFCLVSKLAIYKIECY